MRCPGKTFLHITLFEFGMLELLFKFCWFCVCWFSILVAVTSCLSNALCVSQGAVAKGEFTGHLAVS